MTRAVLARRIGRALTLVAVALLAVWFVRRLDVAKLRAALAAASLPLVTLAAILNLAQLVVRALLLRTLLAPLRVVGVARLYRYNLALFAANNLLPARAGEWVRIELLRVREKVPRSASLAVALVEKVFDVIALLLLALPLPLLLPGLPRSVWVTTTLLGAAGLVALAGTIALAHWGRDAPGWRGQLARGATVVRRPRAFAAALGWGLLSYVVDAAAIVVCMRALHLGLPVSASLLVLLGVTVVLALPTAPAGLGSLEIGAVAALRLLGVDDARALAFALVYHAMQAIPVTALGLLALARARDATSSSESASTSKDAASYRSE